MTYTAIQNGFTEQRQHYTNTNLASTGYWL